MILWSERICIVASLCNIKFAYAQNTAHHAWETPNSSTSDCMKQSYTNFKLRNHIETHYIIGQVSCSHPVWKAEFACTAKKPYVILSHSSTSPCKNTGEREKALKTSDRHINWWSSFHESWDGRADERLWGPPNSSLWMQRRGADHKTIELPNEAAIWLYLVLDPNHLPFVDTLLRSILADDQANYVAADTELSTSPL